MVLVIFWRTDIANKKLWITILLILLLGGGFWYMTVYQKPASSPTQTMASTAPAVKNQIIIQQNSFSPDSLTVKVGDTVTWVNEESYGHNVVGDNGLFTSPKLATGEKFSFTYTKAGTFTYICSIHPFMHGTVIVTP